jgi:large subunit ribosomal protein L9
MSKNVEILLTEDVLKLGTMGDIVSVKAGYARNHLLPYGKAIPASSAAKRQIEVLRERAAKNAAEQEGRALAAKKTLEGLTVEIAAKVSHDRHLFGSVGTLEIVAAMADKGHKLDPRQVHLHENFKELGSYTVLLKLFRTVDVNITVNVVDADPQGQSMDEVLATADGEEEA